MELNENTTVFQARRERLKQRLREKNLPGLLVSHAANRYYLSGYELHDPQCNETAGWLVITPDGRDYLLTDSRYKDAARRVWPAEDVFIYSGRRHDDVLGFLKGAGLTDLAFEAKAMNLFDYEKLKDDLNLSPFDNLVEKLRIIKDQTEIDLLKASCALNHKVFRQIQSRLEPGRTESEVAWEIEKMFRDNGASESAFSPIVGVGPNAALPHAIPGETTLRDNELVLIDVGGRLGNYCSDQTRTFWVGDTPSERFLTVREQVKGAQKAAMDMMRPGVKFEDAYFAARKHFEQFGVESRFTHALGHGVGLETHEPPSLGLTAKGEFEAGMVVTVEPGLYYPDWGGVRWEFMVLVTEDGVEAL